MPILQFRLRDEYGNTQFGGGGGSLLGGGGGLDDFSSLIDGVNCRNLFSNLVNILCCLSCE